MSLKSGSATEGKPDPISGVDLSALPEGNINPADTLHVNALIDGRSEYGRMRISASEVRYVGSDHWAAIMDNIADLKDHFNWEEQLRLIDSPEQIDQDISGGDDGDLWVRPHALLLYGCDRPASRAEVLAALPPKSTVDRYIARYFNLQDLISCWLPSCAATQHYQTCG